MNISDEAVEAAARRIGDAVTVRDITTILEAAAPHMNICTHDDKQGDSNE